MMSQTPATQSGFATFTPKARLLRLIGAELISDEVVAITELVKNAHDADATQVSIEFLGVTEGNGEILIRDDGHGMDLDTLLMRWMQPASSSKGREGKRFTPGGRRVLGEKGVGRFAADKLGAHLELVSRRPGEPTEIRAAFNWDDFSSDEKMLSDVRSRWEVRPADWIERSGTVLRITALKTTWNERLFRRLSTRLSRLVSPFGGGAGFKIHIESDEFPQYAGEVSGFLEDAPYRVEAELATDRMVVLRVGGGRASRVPWEGERLRCGPVRARLFAFDLETEALARIGPRVDVRAWLREWSGVSVYRDGFRVWPYGEPHDDWLRLDQRRVNNPVIRLSNNQLVGFVEISGDQNPELRDQTNREGLIHNESFEDLQKFILFAIQMLETERQARRHPAGRRDRRGTEPAASAGASLAETLESLARRAKKPLSEELRRTAALARAQHGAQEATQRRMLDGYSDLAALGHTAGVVGRSVAASLGNLRSACGALRKLLGGPNGTGLAAVFRPVLEHLEPDLAMASDQLAMLTQAPGLPSRRRRGLDVPAELDRTRFLLGPLLERASATLDIAVDGKSVPRIEMRPEAFMALINVLVANAIEWASPRRPLRMQAAVTARSDSVEILFSDNGKGVLEPLQESLFEPLVSGRVEGAGMGLTIARNIVSGHGGTISLVKDRRRKGATFRISLPRKRPRATMSMSQDRG